jgi:hypothetical protein
MKKRKKGPTFQITQKQLQQAIKKDKKKQFQRFLKATNTEKDQSQFYLNIRHLKAPKSWTTDPAYGKEDTILKQINKDKENTFTQTQQIQSRLDNYNAST